MPELPEVETVRADLHRTVRGVEIGRVMVATPTLVRGSDKQFKRKLKGVKITRVARRGKLLVFHLDSGEYLLVHLKMTGQLIYQMRRRVVAGGHPWPSSKAVDSQKVDLALPGKHTHVVISFVDGTTLYFNDQRKFGYLQVVDETGLKQVLDRFGVEPLTAAFTPEKLWRLLHGRTTALKNVLLDQSSIAGLGNIYVDEASFAAGVRPMRPAHRITQRETKVLHRVIQRILARAVRERGTTFGSFRDGLGVAGNYVRLLKVYGRGGMPCKRCKKTLKKVVVGGRGTVYCAACQV